MPCPEVEPRPAMREGGVAAGLFPMPAWNPVWILALLLGACQAQPTMPETGAGAQSEAGLRQRIAEAVGPAACVADADCRTLPMGAKSCGGPASWLAWSARQSNGAQLQAWSTELAARQRQRLDAAGIASTCSVVPDPGSACRAGRCVLNDAAARGPSAR